MENINKMIHDSVWDYFKLKTTSYFMKDRKLFDEFGRGFYSSLSREFCAYEMRSLQNNYLDETNN